MDVFSSFYLETRISIVERRRRVIAINLYFRYIAIVRRGERLARGCRGDRDVNKDTWGRGRAEIT